MKSTKAKLLNSTNGLVLMASTVSSVLLASTSPTFAQDAQAAPVGGLDTITVTARKRAENLQETPISITALDRHALRDKGITNIQDVKEFAPNLEINNGLPDGGGSAAQVTIRGIGQQDFLFPNDPGVGLYVDGVYIGRSMGALLGLVDIERVEVLRGPQGTLFGRNTIGGAVNIVTQKPGDEFAASFNTTLGKYDRRDFTGSINFPLGQNAALRLSAALYNRDGFQRRLFSCESPFQPAGRPADCGNMGDEDKEIYRAALRITPTDAFDINLSIEYSDVEENGPAGGSGRFENTFLVQLYNGEFLGDPIIGGPPSLIEGLNPVLGLPAGTSYDERWAINDRFGNFAGGPSINENESFAATLTLDYALSDMIDIKSITAYRDMNALVGRDADMTPYPIGDTLDMHEADQISQELQLVGTSFDDRLSWVVGGYYFTENAQNDNDVLLLDGTVFPTSPGDDATTVLISPLNISLSPDNVYSASSVAGFGHFVYDLTDQLSIIVGGRYTSDKKEYTQDHVRLVSGDQIVLRTRDDTWSSFDYKVGLDYQATDDVLLYANYSTGFKSGGWGPRPLSAADDVDPYDPETLDTIELGAKTTLFDNRVRANVAAFHSFYKDVQLTVTAPNPDPLNPNPVLNVRNGAKAELTGFEVEVSALLTNNLTVDIGAGYVHSEFTEVDPGATEITLDTRLPDAPRFSGNMSVAYNVPLGSYGDLTFRWDGSYTGEAAKTIPNFDFLIADSYSLSNFRVTYESPNEMWSVSGFIDNAFDENYITHGRTISDFGYSELYYGRPREYGVTLGVRF